MLNRRARTIDRHSPASDIGAPESGFATLGGVAATCLCVGTLTLESIAYGGNGLWPLDSNALVAVLTSRFLLIGLGVTTSLLLAPFVALLGRARLRAEVARKQAENLRAQAAEAIESERDLLRHVVSRAPIHMAMFDNEMRYIAASDMWMTSRSHGRPEAGRDGHIGKCHYDVVPDDRDVWGHLHARGLAGETLSKSEDCYVHADGTTSWLKWTIQPWYQREGAIGGIFIVSEFIDELVSSRDKALESARAKSNFLATISHEIRTPLNGILGMAELLAETPLDAEQLRYLGYARQSAGNLLTLVDDVLDFSKIESGRVDLRNEDFDLHGLLAEVTSSFGILAEKKGVLLTASVADDVPPRVVGDCDRLRQILVNLIGNAVKFTPQGDVIVAAKRALGASPAEPTRLSLVRIEVSDTGVGIAPSALGRLFQPFTQEDSSTSRRFGGTGLGLAITKRLVELMGGHVGAASVQGLGTTFWVELPLGSVEASERTLLTEPTVGRHPSAPAFLEDAPWLPGTRVLVAEDNEINAFLIRRMLDILGLSNVVVEHGEDVLRVLEHSAVSGDRMGLNPGARSADSEGRSPTGRRSPFRFLLNACASSLLLAERSSRSCGRSCQGSRLRAWGFPSLRASVRRIVGS